MTRLPEEHIEQLNQDDLRDHGLPKDDLTCSNLNERKVLCKSQPNVRQ